MKTKYPTLMLWWTLYWLAAAILEWFLSAQILSASQQSRLAILGWFFLIFLMPFIVINTAICLQKGESRDVRLFHLRSKVCTLSLVAALLAANWFALVPCLLITVISSLLLVFVCFQEHRKLRTMRETGDSNHFV